MSRFSEAASRVSRLYVEGDAILRRLHGRVGVSIYRATLTRALESGYRARFGEPNYPRLLQAEQELKDAMASCKAWRDELWT